MDDLDDIIVAFLREQGLTVPIEWVVDHARSVAGEANEDEVWSLLNGELRSRGVYQTTAPIGVVYGITE